MEQRLSKQTSPIIPGSGETLDPKAGFIAAYRSYDNHHPWLKMKRYIANVIKAVDLKWRQWLLKRAKPYIEEARVYGYSRGYGRALRDVKRGTVVVTDHKSIWAIVDERVREYDPTKPDLAAGS